MLVKPIEAPTVCPRDALLQDFEGELLQQGYWRSGRALGGASASEVIASDGKPFVPRAARLVPETFVSTCRIHRLTICSRRLFTSASPILRQNLPRHPHFSLAFCGH